VIDDILMDENISNFNGGDASVLMYCRKFVYQPTASSRTVTLPGRAAIEALINNDLSRGGNSPGYLWSGKHVGYQSWIELEVLVTRWATKKLTVICPAPDADIADNNGNTVSGVDLEKGDVVKFIYHNSAWYIQRHNG
jgi:hypothetical protein